MDPLDLAILALRVALVAVLYAFLWLVVRAALRTLKPATQRPPERPPAAAVQPTTAARVLRLVVLESGGADLEPGQVLVVEGGLTFGRSERAGVVLTDAAVSAEHARIERHNGQWVVVDLGSTNGTLLNQAPIDGQAALEIGDVLGLGTVRLKVVGR